MQVHFSLTSLNIWLHRPWIIDCQTNSSYSSFAEILLGVPQQSILGPLLFNAYICDLFYDIDDLDFAGFADDNFPYSCLSDMISVLWQLKGGINKIFDWFKKISKYLYN